MLVDRLWPRGLTKEKARIDEWLKEIAPSTALRKTFKHDPDRWDEFRKKYWAELDDHREEVKKLARDARSRTVTLLFSTRETERNNAVALKQYIDRVM